MQKKRKRKSTTIVWILVLAAGIGILLYPLISDYSNSLHQTEAIATYVEAVEAMDDSEYEKIKEEADTYNQNILFRKNPVMMSDLELQQYYRTLDVTGTGIMGYIEIPVIDVSLPVYHGTEDAVLQIAAGHIEWSSLPVGGENTHCVISGHRGLTSARLFSDLNEVQRGDYFVLHVLDETLTYEVDQILIVEPEEIDSLLISEGKDLCSLVTCTPYGINTQRLIVRGKRISSENLFAGGPISSDAVKIDPIVVAPIVGIPLLVILIIVLTVHDRRKKKRGE